MECSRLVGCGIRLIVGTVVVVDFFLRQRFVFVQLMDLIYLIRYRILYYLCMYLLCIYLIIFHACYYVNVCMCMFMYMSIYVFLVYCICCIYESYTMYNYNQLHLYFVTNVSIKCFIDGLSGRNHYQWEDRHFTLFCNFFSF